MTPYYEASGVRIYHGDCRDVLPLLAGCDADLVLTDPPYNAGKAYGKHDDAMTAEAYTAWCAEWFGLSRAICRRTIVFPGHGNIGVWYAVRRPSAVGCWDKIANFASGHLGAEEWEPWLYWGQRIGGSSVIREPCLPYDWAGGHPNPKPVRLMRKFLLKFKSRIVLDPFMGSGSTLRAAKDLGCSAIGIELEERWCEVAAIRLSQEVLPLEASA